MKYTYNAPPPHGCLRAELQLYSATHVQSYIRTEELQRYRDTALQRYVYTLLYECMTAKPPTPPPSQGDAHTLHYTRTEL